MDTNFSSNYGSNSTFHPTLVWIPLLSMSGNSKRVAVIGAGISGVVTAAHLKNEGIDVTVFERSSTAGGVW